MKELDDAIKEVIQMATDNKRRKGKPRSEAEREARHKRLHPGTKLPPRGTGLKKTTKK